MVCTGVSGIGANGSAGSPVVESVGSLRGEASVEDTGGNSGDISGGTVTGSVGTGGVEGSTIGSGVSRGGSGATTALSSVMK